MDKDFITLEETKDQLIGVLPSVRRENYRISPRKNLAGWLVYRRHKSRVLRMVRT